MANKINLNEGKSLIQLPKSLRELRICLNSEEGVQQLIEAIAADKIATREARKESWCEKEPLCLRELIRTVMFDERLQSAIAPLFAATDGDIYFKYAMLKELSGKEGEPPSSHSIESLAAQPAVFFQLCKKAFEVNNYKLFSQLTQYCVEHPEFAQQSGKEIQYLLQDVLFKDDPVAFADLMDKGLLKFYFFSMGWADKGLDIDVLLGTKKTNCLDIFIKKGAAFGQKIANRSLEDFGKWDKGDKPEGWDLIQLAVANGAIVDPPPPKQPSWRYVPEKEKKAEPFKEEAYQLMLLRRKLYAELNGGGPHLSYLEWLGESEFASINDSLIRQGKPPLNKEELVPFVHLQEKLNGGPFNTLSWLKESELNCLYTWLKLDKDAAQVIKKYPDFFRSLLHKNVTFRQADLSIILPKYIEAGCFDPVEDGKLLFKAIEQGDVKALVALKRAGVSLKQVSTWTRLNPFQYALRAYCQSTDPAELQSILPMLKILLDCEGVDCNEPFPDGRHPIEMLLGSDLENRQTEANQPRFSREKLDLLKQMLRRGADLRSCHSLSLMRMIDKMHVEDLPLLNLLVSYGISVTEQDAQGSVLHALLYQCPHGPLGREWLKLLNALIARDPQGFASVRDNHGKTPLELAISLNNPKLVLLLLQWGVVPEGFSLQHVDLTQIDPSVRKILEMFTSKLTPSTPTGLGSVLTLKTLANFFGDVILKEQRSGKDPKDRSSLEGQPGGDAVEFISVVLAVMGKDLSGEEREKVQKAQQRLEKAIPIFRLLQECALDRKFRVQYLPVACSYFRSQIESLQTGEVLLLPAGWVGLEGTGHAMLVEISRDQNGLFSLKVMNTGDGIQHHARRQTPLKHRVNSVRHFDRITQEQLLNTAFIETLFAPRSYLPQDGADRYTADDIYHFLFSRFEKNALSLDEEKEGHFRTPQRSGTCSMRVCLAYLEEVMGTECYKKTKIGMEHLIFQALEKGIMPGWRDSVFVHLLEHMIRKSSLNLHKHQELISTQTIEEFGETMEKLKEGAEFIREMNDKYPVLPAEVEVVDDPAQKIVTSIDAVRSQLISPEVDPPSAIEPSPYLDLPQVNFSSLSAAQWTRGMDQLISFFDASSTNRSDPLRTIPIHLTTEAIATLPLPNGGIFNAEIDANHPLGSLSYEQKTELARQIKGLAQRYATAFYKLRESKKNKWDPEPELVEQYLCINKLYATYWRLMLHLEKTGENNISLQEYGLDISHLKALQNSIHLPTYSPQVATQLAELIAFFETSHPDKNNAKKTLLSIRSWKVVSDGWSYNSYKLPLPLEGDLGEVDLFDRYYDKIPPANWVRADVRRDYFGGGWEKPDEKKWRLANLFVDPAHYTDSHLAAYHSLREMALTCWSFKEASQQKWVTFPSPEWSGEKKQIETSFSCEVGYDKRFHDIVENLSNPFAVAKHGYPRGSEALEGKLAQNDYTINRDRDIQHFYDIAHSELFALDRLLSHYEDHVTTFNQEQDRWFFQALLFGKDRLKTAIEKDPTVANRLMNCIEQALCEFELQLGMSPAREDLFKTVMFFKALKLRVVGYLEEMGHETSLTKEDVGAEVQKWIEQRLASQLPDSINQSDLHLLWICAQPDTAWKDPNACIKALVHLAQAEYLGSQEELQTRDYVIWKAWAIKQLFSHVQQIQETVEGPNLIVAAQRIALLYGIPVENLTIEGAFPQVVMRDEHHIYELNLLNGIFVRDQISLTNSLSHRFESGDEKDCFRERKTKNVMYRVSSHDEENRKRYRYYVSSGGKHYFMTNFQDNSPEWKKQIQWERGGEIFTYASFDTIPKEWKEVPLPHLPKKNNYCYWMNTQDSAVCGVIEHTATGQEEIVIYRDGSIERNGKPGRWRLVDPESMEEIRSLMALQPKTQVAVWEATGDTFAEEIHSFGLLDKEGTPIAFSRKGKDEPLQCMNFPGYHLAEQQRIKGLGRHFPYAVLENAQGEKRVLIPVKGWSEVVNPSEEKNSEKRYPVELIPVDSREQLSVLSTRQKLLLAYNFLGGKHYDRAMQLLISSATSSLYTPEELQMLAWIFLHHQQTHDHSPRAKALSLLAAHLVRQNLSTFPEAYPTSHNAEPITDLYAAPSAWVDFWKGRITQCSGKQGEKPNHVWQSLGELLIGYYDMSSHLSGDCQIFERHSNPFQEAEWLQEIIKHAPYPELIHRLRYLVSPHTPDVVHMDSHEITFVPKIPFEKKDFNWTFRSESIAVSIDEHLQPLEPILNELNRIRPEKEFKNYFSQLFLIARKGTGKEQQKLLQFLRDMQYDPSETNQILRAILLSQLSPYNTYEYTESSREGPKKVSDRIAEVIEKIAKSSNRSYESGQERGNLIPLLKKWHNHYFPPAEKATTPIDALPDIAALLPSVSLQKTPQLPSFQIETLDPSIPELNCLAEEYFDYQVNDTASSSYPPLPSKMAKDPYFQMRAEELREDIDCGVSLNASQVSYRLKEGKDIEVLKTTLLTHRNHLRTERKALKTQIKELVLQVSDSQNTLNAKLLRRGGKDIPPTMDECLALFVQGDLSLYRKRLPFLSDGDCRILHEKIGQFLQKATEEQRWERCLKCLAKAEADESAVHEIALEMSRVREYIPSQYPPLMVFEYYADFALRKEQVDNLIRMTTVDANGKFPPCLLQMIMSAGKTSVLGTLLALMKADGYHLSMLLTPKSALETNALEMKERNSRFFGQRGDVITFNRGSAYFNVPYLRRLYNQLIETINHRRYVILVPETLLSMQNQYTEAREKIRALKAKKHSSLAEQRRNEAEIKRLQTTSDELKKILDLIETRGARTKDEIDTLHAARKELNYPGVNIEHLDRISIDLVGALYKIASCDPEIRQLGIDLHANTQSRLLPDQIERIKQLLGHKMANAIAGNPLWCQHLGIPVPCDEKKVTDLEHYLSNPDYAAPEWISALHDSPIESSRMGAERLTLLRQEIVTWLPACWKLSASEHFSRSKEDPKYLAAKPNISANTPNENAEIAHAWELVNKTLQLYVSCGADESQAKIIIQNLQKLAVLQRNKVKVEEGMDPHAVIEQTEAAKLFKRLVGADEHLMQIDIHDAATLKRMHKVLNSEKSEAFSLIIEYLTDHVFPELEFHTDQIDNNAMNVNNDCDQGYSGTIGNLYIFDHQFTQRPQETVILDRGAYGRVIDIMCRLNRTVHGVSAALKTPHDLMQEIHATKPVQEQNTFKAFIDIGAFFKGQTNLEIARSFLSYFSTSDSIQGILYYDDATNQLACLKKGEEDKPIIIGPTDAKSIYAATSLSPDQLFTFYDQFHTTGANIIQAPDAKAFYTIGDQTVLRDQLQGMMRMRSLLGGSQGLEGIIPQDLVPLISHRIEQSIDGVPTIEQVFLFGEVNGLHHDAEDNIKVFLVKLQAAVRKYARSYLYTCNDPAQEEAFYEAVRQFFIRSVKEELFLQYGGVSKKTKKDDYIADRLSAYLTALEEVKSFLSPQHSQALEQELREIAAVATNYLPLDINESSIGDKTTVEKVVENAVEKLTEQEVQTQTALASRDKPKEAVERKWDFSSYEVLMQQLCSFHVASLADKPLMRRLPEVMADKLDLSLFSECFSPNILVSTNFLETSVTQENLLDKLQKSPLEALIFYDQDKIPHLVLLSSKEAEGFAQFIEKENVPLTLLNLKADPIRGTHPIDDHNIDIEQLRIQMLFFSGRFSSLEQDRWQRGLDAYLATKRELKRDLFEVMLLPSSQALSYQHSELALKLNAPSTETRSEESNNALAVLKRAKFLFNQKRIAQCQDLIDENLGMIRDTAEIGQLIDLAALNAASADWAFSLFQKILPLAVGQKGLIDKLITALGSPLEYRIKKEIAGFILRQPDLSTRQLEVTFQNAIAFQVDHEVKQQAIVEKFEQLISLVENSPDPEAMIPYARLVFDPPSKGTLSYDTRLRQTCFNVLESIVAIARNPNFSDAQKHLLCSCAAPYLEAYFKFVSAERLSVEVSNSRGEYVNEVYDKLGEYYGHFPELDELLEKGLINSLLKDISRYGWERQYKILSQVNIPHVQERAENIRLRFNPEV